MVSGAGQVGLRTVGSGLARAEPADPDRSESAGQVMSSAIRFEGVASSDGQVVIAGVFEGDLTVTSLEGGRIVSHTARFHAAVSGVLNGEGLRIDDMSRVRGELNCTATMLDVVPRSGADTGQG